MDPPEKAQGSKGPTLEWMYKPSALVDREEYLTGRSVDKSLKLLDEIEKGNNVSEFNYLQEAEKDLTPLSIFTSQGSSPLDLIKKIKDDPLYQIQKKEQESLKKLLQNPVRMKELNKLVEARDDAKSTSKKSKHKRKSKDKKHKKRKHKDDDRRNSRLERSSSSFSSTDDRERNPQPGSQQKSFKKFRNRSRSGTPPSRSRRSPPARNNRSSGSDLDEREKKRKEIIEKFKRKAEERRNYDQPPRSDKRPNSTNQSFHRESQRTKLDDEELERRRKEMMDNAKWREQQRTKNVSKFREQEKKEEEDAKTNRDSDFIRKQLLEAANSGSVEQRVKSNSYNIQRSKASMNQNFLKR